MMFNLCLLLSVSGNIINVADNCLSFRFLLLIADSVANVLCVFV